MVVRVTEETMLNVGLHAVGFTQLRLAKACRATNVKRFCAFFGITPLVCSVIFRDVQVRDIGQAKINKPKSIHFLMTLFWLKRYQVEKVIAGIFGYSEETIRKWVLAYTKAIEALKIVKIVWNGDLHNNNQQAPQLFCERSWLLSVDGVHCQIQEPRSNPDKKHYSYKHNKPGVVYELGVALNESKLVWINGPFQAGNSDMAVFRMPEGLRDRIPPGMKVIGDRGYLGEPALISTTHNIFDEPEVKLFKQQARARHEDFNNRIKEFDVLNTAFRHQIEKHECVFVAVCVLVQYAMENGRPLDDLA